MPVVHDILFIGAVPSSRALKLHSCFLTSLFQWLTSLNDIVLFVFLIDILGYVYVVTVFVIPS